jgi:hypothetical protein
MAEQATPAKRPQLAALSNIYKRRLHSQHIIDRFLDGFGWDGTYHHPSMDVVSLFVDQAGEGDLSPERAERHPNLKIYPTIQQALTRGTGKLAVDGVIYIGEQGNYPVNEKGQTEYPRFQFFEQVVDVFRSSGRSVPVFVDKHFSWKWEWCKKMYDTSRQMGFPLMAGSSLPITWRIPAVEMPLGASVREAMCVCYGGIDSYDFHGLETLQCMVERRKGGESGVEWLQAYRGDEFWKAHEQGLWSQVLFKAALCRSHTRVPGREGFTDVYPTLREMKALARDPVAYHYQHADGLRCTMMLMNGLVQDFNFAATIEGQPHPLSTMMYLSKEAFNATDKSYFTALAHYIEQLFLSGKEPYPVERTLLTSGLVIAGVDSLFQGQQRIKTPNLAIRYQPGKSTLWKS